MAFLELAVGPSWPGACLCRGWNAREIAQRTEINMFPASHLEQLEDGDSADRAWGSLGRGRHTDWVSISHEAKEDSVNSISTASLHFRRSFCEKESFILLAAASCFRVLATRATAGCQRFFWEEVLHRVACSAVKVVFLLMNVLIAQLTCPPAEQ